MKPKNLEKAKSTIRIQKSEQEGRKSTWYEAFNA
jgi:hypothetical protein